MPGRLPEADRTIRNAIFIPAIDAEDATYRRVAA